jgi:hypothetical protein
MFPWQIILAGRYQSSAAKVVMTNIGRQYRDPEIWSDHPESGLVRLDRAGRSGIFVWIAYIFGPIDLMTAFRQRK